MPAQPGAASRREDRCAARLGRDRHPARLDRITPNDRQPPSASVAPSIAEHRVLGDGTSTALLRPDGEVDWWCAPELDSPPILWSLLDPIGAAARWQGATADPLAGPPAGPTLRTRLLCGGRRIDCWDALHCENDAGTALIRLVRCLDGPLDITHEFAAGGFDAVWGGWTSVGVDHSHVTIGTRALRVVGGDPSLGGDRRWLRSRLRAAPARWAALVVSTTADRRFGLDVLLAQLTEAQREEDALVAKALLPHQFRGRADDALRVLRSCTYAATGAVAASVTTSLPEAPGGDRQFDYRYSWLRDASLAVSVAALLGRRDISRSYLDFILRQAGGSPFAIGPITDVRGQAVPAEREIAGVAGWAGSLPVRVGNAASDQVQYDALGLLVEAVSVHLQMGGHLGRGVWRLLNAVADKAADDPDQDTSGIWEFRTPRPLVSADIGRWIALDRAIWIARIWRPWTRRARWAEARERLRARVLGALDQEGGLPQSYGGGVSPDASALMAVVFGLIDPGDPRAGRLIDATMRALDCWPSLYRYPPSENDGFRGLEATFLPAAFWVVSALARVGRLREAITRMRALDTLLPRLLAEEYDVSNHRSIGNVPLVWSHMEATRALYILDAAALRQRRGPIGLAAWRLGRYARVRARGGVRPAGPGRPGR